MEDSRMEYSNIMESLLKKAHKNKNVLEYKEINDAFVNIPLTPDDFEWILNFLEKHNVDVLNTSEDNSDEDDFLDGDEENVKIIDDTDILEGVSLEESRARLEKLYV